VEVGQDDMIDETLYLQVKLVGDQTITIPIIPGMSIEQTVVVYCRGNLHLGGGCAKQMMQFIKAQHVVPMVMTGSTIYEAGIGAP